MSARIEWAAGFLPNMGGKALGIGYEEEIAPCLSGQLGGANQIDISIKDRMLNARGASGQLQRAGRL